MSDRDIEELTKAIEWAERLGPKATVYGLGDVSYSPQPVVLQRETAHALRAALHVTDTPLTLCFEPGCTLPGHVSRVHETTHVDTARDPGPQSRS